MTLFDSPKKFRETQETAFRSQVSGFRSLSNMVVQQCLRQQWILLGKLADSYHLHDKLISKHL